MTSLSLATLHELIPPVIAHRVKNINNFYIVRNAQGGYTLQLMWDEEFTGRQTEKELAASVVRGSVEVVKTDTILAKCDGPCGGSFKPKEMRSMGRCDHYLCKNCYKIVDNDDGSFGCSSFRCVQANYLENMSDEEARKVYLEKIKQWTNDNKKGSFVDEEQDLVSVSRAVSPSVSLTNLNPATVPKLFSEAKHSSELPMVVTRAIVFNQGKYQLKKVELLCEFPLYILFEEAIKTLLAKSGKKPENGKFHRVRVFQNLANQPLVRVGRDKLEKKLSELEQMDGELRLVIDTAKVINA